MSKRQGTKIELTSDQINKLWPLFQTIIDDAMANGMVSRLSMMGQAWVSDSGEVRGFAKFTVLTQDETDAVRTLLGGTGTTADN